MPAPSWAHRSHSNLTVWGLGVRGSTYRHCINKAKTLKTDGETGGIEVEAIASGRVQTMQNKHEPTFYRKSYICTAQASAHDSLALPVFLIPDYNGLRIAKRRKSDHRELKDR